MTAMRGLDWRLLPQPAVVQRGRARPSISSINAHVFFIGNADSALYDKTANSWLFDASPLETRMHRELHGQFHFATIRAIRGKRIFWFLYHCPGGCASICRMRS
jgi:hypothetical protein